MTRRPDASMTLLTSILERPLDPGYAAAAARRTAQGLPPATSLRSMRALAATLGIGLVLGVGGAALGTSANSKSSARAGLVDQIESARRLGDAQLLRVQALRVEVSGLQGIVSGTTTDAAINALELESGAVPVTGPGFLVTLDDAPTVGGRGSGSDPRAVEQSKGAVLAVDVQTVVNGLWQAGAEAISINGQRLTATSAIRFAGQAILVDFRPLARPYVISAIGNPASLPAAFADGPAGTYASTLAGTYGIVVKTEVVDGVELPAAATLTTRYARPPDAVGDTDSASTSPPLERSP